MNTTQNILDPENDKCQELLELIILNAWKRSTHLSKMCQELLIPELEISCWLVPLIAPKVSSLGSLVLASSKQSILNKQLKCFSCFCCR